MKNALSLVTLVLMTSPAFAEGTRQLDAHEHGVGELNIAVEGQTIVMEFHAPGADIVGFEYEAESTEDRAAIETAISVLSAPLDLFVFPQSAGCSVLTADAELESDHAHDDHDDGDAHHHDHDEDEHHHEGDEDHHGHEEAHDDDAGHAEFHAEYVLNCASPSAIDEITFAYFDTFANAREVEVQIVSASGAQAFDVERDEPILNVEGLFQD